MTTPLPTVLAVCVYADADGVSHLIDVALPALAHTVDAQGVTRFVGATGATMMGFVVGSSAVSADWHVSSMAGLSIALSGGWEIEAGSGARRWLAVGSVLLMLDTYGQGHRAHPGPGAGGTVLGVGIDAATEVAFTALVDAARAAQAALA